jgi:GR25 family glycosyltransferase involved in LPS biosynthesis
VKSFIIHLSKIASSLESAVKTQQDLVAIGITAELFEGTYGTEAEKIFADEGRTVHPIDFKGNATDERDANKARRPGVMGCFYSHYRLWKRCVELNETICVFEDDVKVLRPLVPVEFVDILVIAMGARKNEKYLHYIHDPQGECHAAEYVHRSMPGTVGYMITPDAAKKLLINYKKTFLSSDNAINKGVVTIQIHSHIMGAANLDKQSLTASKKFWERYRNRNSNQ